MNRVVLPERSGSYRWYYADVVAGDWSAVFIFMVGSLFSARYSASLKKGGLPREHSAVNFALYEKGVRTQWVLTEYPDAKVEDGGRTLRIGESTLRYHPGGLSMHVREKLAPWGSRTEATLHLAPQVEPADELRLVDGLEHFWRPIAARATAHLELARLPLKVDGLGYHDGNHGQVPLGSDLEGWEWIRTHHADRTDIVYRPWGAAPAIRVSARPEALGILRTPTAPPETTRTGWGLRVPRSLGVGGEPMLLESSPFYARLEAHRGGVHALGEVADFARFHQPSVRWMARLRTRQGDAP